MDEMFKHAAEQYNSAALREIAVAAKQHAKMLRGIKKPWHRSASEKDLCWILGQLGDLLPMLADMADGTYAPDDCEEENGPWRAEWLNARERR